MARNPGSIYSATYSNVPVYEYNVAGNHVMRRRADDWINATHILKVAEYDKPARTRILEREVQKGVHEKVQGGYGKYQGTWIPLDDGRELAAKNGVLEKLAPIFNYVPGDRSPPPAPKHETAASRPRMQKQPAQRKQAAANRRQTDYDRMDVSMRDGTPDRDTLASESAFDDFDGAQFTGSRRKRMEPQMSQADREHQLWADELLDYFVLQEGGDALPAAPEPPAGANLNRPIDERGHTALHWAAAMADVDVVKDLIRRGASIDVPAKNGETPLMRTVLFTNSYDKQNMEKITQLLVRTVNMQEWAGCTVFHHIAGTTHSKKKYDCARYYVDCILNVMTAVLSPTEVERIINTQDANGDTAITIAARTGARKCVRSLLARHASVDIPNHLGETADHLIVQLNVRRQERHNENRQLSSSPFLDSSLKVGAPLGHHLANGIPFDPLVPHSKLNGVNGTKDVYRSEVALTLTSQYVPLIFSKAKALAKSIDDQIVRKDEELAEAERVLEARQAEMKQLQLEKEQLRQAEADDDTNEAEEEVARQLAELEEECEQLTEEENTANLRALIAERENNMDVDDDMELDAETIFHEKVRIARELAALQRERQKLAKQVVQNLAVAGVGDHQGKYKRLIQGALHIEEGDIESMLPEILAELEDAQQMEQVGG